jgi:hypothetical protein
MSWFETRRGPGFYRRKVGPALVVQIPPSIANPLLEGEPDALRHTPGSPSIMPFVLDAGHSSGQQDDQDEQDALSSSDGHETEVHRGSLAPPQKSSAVELKSKQL